MTTNETQTAAADGSVERSFRPVAWADDMAALGHVGNCASDAAKRYWERSHWVDKANAARLKHPLYTQAAMDEKDAEREVLAAKLARANEQRASAIAVERERYSPLMQAVEQLLDAGHMDTEGLARLRAAWEAA